MSIFNNLFPRRMQVQEMQKQLTTLGESVTKYQKAQEFLVNNILALQQVQAAYKGNDYQEYGMAVKAISDKYNCIADWGCLHTGIIIDLRAAFILGEGVKIIPTTQTKVEAQNELQWCEDFFSWNDLDAEMAGEIAKEAEIEGKIALKLIYEEEEYREWPGMISVRFFSWSKNKYTIKADPKDYAYYKELVWKPDGQGREETLTEEQFVYKKFGGRLNNPNEAQPKLMRCLTQIDRLDKALRDLREIDHLFASPTPHFKVQNPPEAAGLLDKLKDVNWKIGKMMVTTADFSMIGPDPDGIQNLISEIELTTKMISGATGIPIHYLGLLDLLKNRATGDNTRELVMAATTKERQVWAGAYEELITKAMQMFNVKAQLTPLDPTKVRVEIPLITQEHWDRIEKVLIPAATVGIISKEAVAEQIPGIDTETEGKRRAEKDAADAAKAKEELALLKAGGGMEAGI
jgi:hypothetical protein